MVSLFIAIELLPAAEKIMALAAICPVNIFMVCEGRVAVREERQDECTLCELCLRAAPEDSIRIYKLYSAEKLCISTSNT